MAGAGWAGARHGAAGRLAAASGSLRQAGLLNQGSDGRWRLTGTGHTALGNLAEARRTALAAFVGDWQPETHPELTGLIRRLARQLLADEALMLRDVANRPAVSQPTAR